MKKHLPASSIILGIFLLAFTSSCKKGVKDPVTLDKAAGTWSINAVRYNITYNSGMVKDSTIPWKPIHGNYVTFDGSSHVNYSFNQLNSFEGYYTLLGSDSILLSFATNNNRFSETDSVTMAILGENSRWKIKLLTATNFNIEKTSTDNKAFPGATVITYQGFVR